ncbi:MAG: hypothetical protein Q8K36_00320, partial [Alphaproteobacteria bacterium]|nr:hypothetical protein [Alphaproteobacteria bacterium]
MKSSICIATLVCFIAQTLWCPIAAMVADTPEFSKPQQHAPEIVVDQVKDESPLNADSHIPIKFSAKKQHLNAIDRFAQSMENVYTFVMTHPYKLLGGLLLAEYAFLMFMVRTDLSLFEQALTGMKPFTLSAAYHQLTAPVPQEDQVYQTLGHMISKQTHLSSILFAAAELYLQNQTITQWWDIQTATDPLLGAFKYLPQVQNLFFQLCLTPQGVFENVKVKSIRNTSRITHSNFQEFCNHHQVDARLAVQRPIWENRNGKYHKVKQSQHFAAFAHFTKENDTRYFLVQNEYEQTQHRLQSTGKMLLSKNAAKPLDTVAHQTFHSNPEIEMVLWNYMMQLRALSCPDNSLRFRLKEVMKPTQTFFANSTRPYAYFYFWFNEDGRIEDTDYAFADTLENFHPSCDLKTSVFFANNAHLRVVIDRSGTFYTTANMINLIPAPQTNSIS